LRHEVQKAGRRKGTRSIEFTSHFLLLRKAGLPPKIHLRAEHDWEREVASRQGERGDKEKEMSIGGTRKMMGGEV
jgi:hypothetical protein